MSKDYLSSNNFRNRLGTGILLAVLVVLSLITPNAIVFRYFFIIAGIMAVIELHLAQRVKVYREIGMPDERIVDFEYIIIFFAVYAILIYLSSIEIIFVLLGATATDTFAYFIGSSFHGTFTKKRPFPKTSPKKSWEGIIGGVAGCMLILFTANMYFEIREKWFFVFIFLCPFFSIFGDFMASFCKRLLNIKDSNECVMESGPKLVKCFEFLMKGHGGFLDRIDSISMVAMLMFFIKFLSATNPQ